MKKYLYIVRHGEAAAAWQSAGGSDYARTLTDRGTRQASGVARLLREDPALLRPQRIVASRAPRAWQTAGIFASVLGVEQSNLSGFRELYSGDANLYLNTLVRSLPDEADCAMIAGHNPAVSELLAQLCGAMPGEYRMRTADTALVEFDIEGQSWESLCLASGKLVRYVIAGSLGQEE